MGIKLRIRVVDVPATASAQEAEVLLNAPCDDDYYLEKIIVTTLPEGVGTRAFYRLRVKEKTNEMGAGQMLPRGI